MVLLNPSIHLSKFKDIDVLTFHYGAIEPDSELRKHLQ